MRIAWGFSALCLVVLSSSQATAGFVAKSGEIAVSSYASGSQEKASVTATPDGGFFVVWEDTRPQVAGSHVFGRRFDADGVAIGTEVKIDTADGSINSTPDIVAGSGGYFVAWRRDTSAIVARKIDATGAGAGTEFQVNTDRELEGDYYLGAPVLAPAADGGFLVTWSSGVYTEARAELDADVFARRYDASATALAADAPISPLNDTPPYHRAEFRADVVLRPDGNYSVAWTDDGLSLHAFEAFVTTRILDGNGTPVSERSLELLDASESGSRLVTQGESNSLVLFYTSDRETLRAVNALELDADGARTTEPAALSDLSERTSLRSDDVRDLAAATIGADSFAAVWTETETGDDDLIASVFDFDGYPLSAERSVSVTTSGDQNDPEIAKIGASRVAIVWTSDHLAGAGHVFARTFDVLTPACGDGDESGTTTAGDALLALQASVDARPCAPCICDVDGSGSHTATDALLVLRAGVGQSVELACPACPPVPRAPFAIRSETGCVNVHVEIPATALPADRSLLNCEIDPQLVAAGCSLELNTGGDALVFDARGCQAGNRRMFSCFDIGLDAAAMAQAAVAACSCGCAEECFTPQLCTPDGETTACSAPSASIAPSHATAPPLAVGPAPMSMIGPPGSTTTVQHVETTTTSSTTWCGTCCGPFDDTGTVDVASDVEVTEIVVKFGGELYGDCLWCYPFGGVMDFNGSPGLCITSDQPIPAPLSTSCEGYGVFAEPVTVLRALGRNFEPLDPVPPISLSHGGKRR